MNTYIVNEPSKNISALGRQSLKGNWKSAVLAMLIYIVCITVPALIIVALFGGFSEEAMMSEDLMMPGEGLSSVYSLLVSGAFTFGISVYFLDLVRERKSDIGQVFSGFGYYFKTLLLFVVMSIFILLWTLLFIIPGIIASFRYSQAFYILADDPSKDIMQCLKESKALMKGNKANYLFLQLSFIGWYLLIYAVFLIATIVSVVISIAIPSDASFGISMVIIAVGVIAMLIGALFLTPYVMAATTVFYDMVNGNLRPQTDEIPPLSQVNAESMVSVNPESASAPAPVTNNYPELKVDDNNDSVNNDKIEL